MTSIKNINGPTNLVRLEGQINGIKKVIYVFYEYHFPTHLQTECENEPNQDIHQFIWNQLKNSNITTDLFVELMPSDISLNMEYQKYKSIYLSQMRKLFIKKMKYDKKTDKMEQIDNKIRLHYTDIRPYFITAIPN